MRAAERFGTMRQTLQGLCEYAGTGSRVRSVPSRVAAPVMKAVSKSGLAPFADYHWLMYARDMWFDTGHARETLGWRSRYSNDEMFREAYDWFLVNRARVSQSGPSHHRSGVKQGVLRVGKAVLARMPGA